jgi:hypothetical protein
MTMRPLTVFLSRLLGLLILALSLAMALHRQSFAETAETLIADRPLLLIIGMAALVAGLAMTLSHDGWAGGPLPVIVTLIGWITLIRGLVVLLLPHEALLSLFKMFQLEKHFYVYVATSSILGLYLTFMGFWGSRS